MKKIAYIVVVIACVGALMMVPGVHWAPELFPYGAAIVSVCILILNFLIGMFIQGYPVEKAETPNAISDVVWFMTILLIIFLSFGGDLMGKLALAVWFDFSLGMTWHIVIFPSAFLAGILTMFIQKKRKPEEAN